LANYIEFRLREQRYLLAPDHRVPGVSRKADSR
jgi:hypothetical protein